MRRLLILFILFALLLQSCQVGAANTSQPVISSSPQLPSTGQSPVPSGQAATALFSPSPKPSSPTPTESVDPTLSPSPLLPSSTAPALPNSPASSPLPPSATATESVTPTLTPSPHHPITPLPTSDFTVRFHPDGGLYIGDQVSMEVIAASGVNLKDHKVQVSAEGPGGGQIGTADFTPYGYQGNDEGILLWSWDTSHLAAGEHTLSFSVLPGGPTWTETVTLQPASALPADEKQAHWISTETDCCMIYTISNTAAQRDLNSLEQIADQQAADVAKRLDTQIKQAMPVNFLPRVLGQGGFTSDEISVSYLDRNYAGSTVDIVLHHEMVHALDGRLGGDLRPTIFVEGLAVYLSGGHFKHEPLIPLSAAVLDLGQYLPMIPLADNFYTSQHEISYWEAGALIEYMVNTWGWKAFSDFYRDIHPDPSNSQSKAIDTALQKHFKLTFAELEQRFLEELRAQTVTQQDRENARLTVDYYNTMRRYQQALDPSAFFMSVWLPNVRQMREKGSVADYLRHPSTAENVALEALLVSANAHLLANEYAQVETILQAVNAVLDAVDRHSDTPFAASPLAQDSYSITNVLAASGYQLQRVEINGNSAQAWVTAHTGSPLFQVKLVRGPQGWNLSSLIN